MSDSDARRDLLGRLYLPPTLFHSRRADPLVLEEIARSGDLWFVPGLVPALFSKDRRTVALAAAAVDTLLRLATPDDLVRLDDAMRRSWYWYASSPDEWRRITPGALAKWVGPREPGTSLLRLASFHSNGFVREAAVRRLGTIRDGSELPFLLIRLGDWVAEVRSAARVLIAERVRPDYAAHFLKSLELIRRLERTTRAGRLPELEAISALLAGTEARGAMLHLVEAGSSSARRWAFDVLLQLPAAELRRFLVCALANSDPMIRIRAAKRIGEVLTAPEIAAAFGAMASEPSGPVRREILRIAASHQLDAANGLLRSGLLDRSAVVREEARFWLRRQGQSDFASCYLDQLHAAAEAELPSAIMGLGETGSREHAQEVVAYLSHPRPSVRRAAVRAVAALDPGGHTDELLGALGDSSAAVSAVAARALRSQAGSLEPERLWRILESTGTPHVRRNALRMILMTNKWDAIGYLLEAAALDDGDVRSWASDLIHRWVTRYNLAASVPTNAQLSRVASALPEADGISPQDRKLIAFAVAGFA